MANLFGKNKLREIAQKIDTESVLGFIEIVESWRNDYHNGSLKKDKETSREQQYNRDFFLNILGYAEKPATPFSFEPKATTEKGQLPDAVVSYTDKANDITNIAAVVELKGTAIDLDRPQRREGNFSPVQQAFKYKSQYRNCPFVIASNFWEFRLYHDNLLDYEVWTLDDLVSPDDDYLLFKTWFALLKKDNFTIAKGASKTEALLSDIRIEQENIGKKFYKVYREARLDLLRDIYKHNDHIKTDIDSGIEKVQKIIDRVVFAAFAEDRGLLPDNTLQRVIKAADSSAFGGSLWNMLKGFFEAIDSGSEKLEIPDGYNGGLFKRDDALNNLQISDEPLRKVVELGAYNFAEDLSVNILGHIFEQSISDLEEIKNKVSEHQSLETISQSRRKKDGIFYTPDYIVRYIVDNSLGAYLREHEEKFKDGFGLKGDILDKTYEKRETQAYTKYQDFLQNVKIVDPACGSGAFLVYVFDYLLAENKRVGDILGNSLFSSDAYVRDILRNNIYGVDLNEESVEITKLSLWLKTAQKGKKLTTLDDNIKCGNSLIDDPTIAGEKAFDWQEQFADVFKRGGFDVVVGNPPWGAFFNEKSLSYLLKKYPEVSVKSKDSYLFFLLLAFKITKTGGEIGFITPNTWLLINSAKDFRKYLLEFNIEQIIDHGDGVFQDATVESCTFISKNMIGTLKVLAAVEKRGERLREGFVSKSSWSEDDYSRIILGRSPAVHALLKKLQSQSVTFNSVADIIWGIKPYQVGHGVPVQTKEMLSGRIYHSSKKADDSWKPLVIGSDIDRYSFSWSGDRYIQYGKNLMYPSNEEKILSPKILLRQTSDKLRAVLDEDKFYPQNSVFMISPKGSDIDLRVLLAILNSTLLDFVYTANNPQIGKTFAEIKPSVVKSLPIVIPKDQTVIGEKAELMITLNKDLHSKSIRFQSLIVSEFGLEKLPAKLNKWWTLDFADFVKALKVNLSLTQKDELLGLFYKYQAELVTLDATIKKTEHEIDQLVYKLYDLAPEEISMIEIKEPRKFHV